MLDTVSGFQPDIVLPWTPERIELLRKLWSDVSLSAARIAAQLGGGATRNSILGKVHRLGLSDRPRGNQYGAPGQPKAPRTAPTKAPHVVQRKSADASRAPEQPQDEVIVQPFAIAIPVSRRVTIMELGLGDCRWPLGDPLTPEFRYCGSRCDPSLPYCVDHGRIAYQPSEQKPRRYFVTNHAPATVG